MIGLATRAVSGMDNLMDKCKGLANVRFVFRHIEKAPQSLYSISLAEPTAIVVGAEDEGISPELLRLADAQVYIPFCGSIASLNVSAAVMFEAVGSGGMQPKIPPLQRLFFSLNLFLRCYQ